MLSKEEVPKGVTMKNNHDGSENKEYIDLLDEDKPLSGQKFACLSFISPEKIIKQKNIFFFEEFLKGWEFQKSMEKYLQFLNFVSVKYKMEFSVLNNDFEEFCKMEKETLSQSNLLDEYKTFLDNHEDDIQQKFNKQNEFQTSVRGIKVRGVFGSQEEAELRCKMLRQADPNHDVYVGPVGMWVPFHPEAYKTGRVEYMEETLNQLMSEKNKNESAAKEEFDKRVKETKQQAIEENRKIAEKSGNKLTQTINEKGELVSINNMNTQETEIEKMTDASLENIKKTLFEGDDIVTDKNTDHGLGDILKRQETKKED